MPDAQIPPIFTIAVSGGSATALRKRSRKNAFALPKNRRSRMKPNHILARSIAFFPWRLAS